MLLPTYQTEWHHAPVYCNLQIYPIGNLKSHPCFLLVAAVLDCDDFIFFSFRCGTDYHAPTDCATIKKWLTKCADDSETANYISAHTKDVSLLWC